MHELIYTSVANWDLSTKELTELLEQSRLKNARLEVTGILVYHDRGFMQLLEGEKKVIFDLLHTITQDPRHTSVRLFWNADIKQRSFRDWTMAFINTSEIDLGKLAGYSTYLEKGMDSLHLTGSRTKGRRLLNFLRDTYLTTA